MPVVARWCQLRQGTALKLVSKCNVLFEMEEINSEPLKLLFVAVFLGSTSTGLVGLCFLWFYVQELPNAQPALVLKRLRRWGNGLSDRLGEAGNGTYDPWFTRHRFIPYTTGEPLKLQNVLFSFVVIDIFV